MDRHSPPYAHRPGGSPGIPEVPCPSTTGCTSAASAPAPAEAVCCRRGQRYWESSRQKSWRGLSLRSFEIKLRPRLRSVRREGALFADRVRPLKDPVLPGGEPAEDLRFHRFGAGKSEIGFHAGERIRRECRTSFDGESNLVVPVELVRHEGDEASV